jgi:hypothetical protein
MYKLSPKRPAVVTGKTLKIRVHLKGRKIIPRPNPLSSINRRGVLPSMKYEKRGI